MKKRIMIIVAIGTFFAIAHPYLLPAQTLKLDYSTYLGGGRWDYGYGITVDITGSSYLVGYTRSSNFPTHNPYQSSHGGGDRDIWISKFSSSGSALIYSTYLGGNADDYGYDIAVESDSAYITGITSSYDFPTKNPYQASGGGPFVTKLSSSGSILIFSTYLGVGGYGRGILVEDGSAYVVGYTESYEFPMKNPYQSTNAGGFDAFISRLSSSGSVLLYSTYLGGSDWDYGRGIAIESGSLYIGGYTGSSNFPLANPYQSSKAGENDVFISRLSSSGLVLLYSTYLGGSGADFGYSIAVEGGSAYVTGKTWSSNFPTLNPYQLGYAGGGDDAFVSKLSTSGSALLYSTYLGGSGHDEGNGIAIDDGSAYVVGYTYSFDFPTENPYQSSHAGVYDAFISRLSISGSALFYSTYLGGISVDKGYDIAVENGSAYITGMTSWFDFPVKNPYQSYFGGSDDAFVSKLVYHPHEKKYHTDFNGDGTSDIAIFRGSSGLWAVRGITRAYFGSGSDLPVCGDYNGDGTTDIGIFRSSSGLWAIRHVTRAYFGSSSDQAVPGDYDGNGACDVGIFRSTAGLWAIQGVTRTYFGAGGDTVAPGDYNGDGTKDIGLFRGGSGLWAIRGVTRSYFGSSSDTVVPGDYDGDGSWDIGIFRPTAGLWAIRDMTRSYFGSGSDQPVPADYQGNGRDDIGIFRGTSGLWTIRGVSRAYFGTSGDIPVTR